MLGQLIVLGKYLLNAGCFNFIMTILVDVVNKYRTAIKHRIWGDYRMISLMCADIHVYGVTFCLLEPQTGTR